jgi:hypothetical protein
MRFLPFILFLVLLTGVQAALNVTVVHHDTDVQSTFEHLKVCSCGTTASEVRIKNIGQLEATYTLTLKSEQDWFTLDRNSVYLMPGEATDVTVYTQAPCGVTQVGSYTVHVASEYGRYRAVEKTMETGVCENILASVSPQYVTVQPCATNVFNINITNTGTFTETYVVVSELILNEETVTIEAGKSHTVVASYNAACDEYGEKTLPVTVHAVQNKIHTSDAVQIAVPRAYDYSITTQQVRGPVCAGAQTNVSVIVRNIESRANTFTVTGEPYSESRTVTVAGGKETTVQLPFTPTQPGAETFTVFAMSGNGSVEKTTTMPLSVDACYGFTITAPQTASACPASVHIPFTVESTGTLAQQIAFSVQSNATTTVNGLNETLYPGQRLTKSVEVAIPDADREFYVTLVAQTPFVREEQTVALRGYSTESCFSVEPANDRFRIWTDQTVQPVVIKHTGVEPATYIVRYNGTFMQPQEKNITLNPGTDGVLHFTINSTGYPAGRYVDRLTLSSHGVDYTTDFSVQLREKGFWQQLMDAIRWNGNFGLCTVLSVIGLLLFLIIAVLCVGAWSGTIYYENPAWVTKSTVGVIGSVLLIVFLILMLLSVPHVARTYERPVQPANESALFYEVGQGEELRLDISKYFADPDKDILTFTANQPEHLAVRVEGTTALVRSARGFTGLDTLVFTASDSRGGETDSELITVSVVAYKPVTLVQWWMAYCWLLTWLFLFLSVALLTLLIVFTKDKKQHIKRNTYMTLYKRPRTDVAVPEIPIQPLAPTVNTQVNAEKIIINQGSTDQLWIASEDGTKFHRMTCPIIKNMPAEKRVVFNTREDALKAGYTPCKTCSSHE